MLADYLVQSQVMGLVMGLVGRISQEFREQTKANGVQTRGIVRWVLFDSGTAGSQGFGGLVIRWEPSV